MRKSPGCRPRKDHILRRPPLKRRSPKPYNRQQKEALVYGYVTEIEKSCNIQHIPDEIKKMKLQIYMMKSFNIIMRLQEILQDKNAKIEKTKKYLIKHFGKIDIILGDLQRHIRGEVSLPVSGLVDMIAPADVVEYKNGTLRTVGGESYIMLVKYSEEDVEIETIIPYGNSNNPESQHYTDQMLMFINKETKKMTLDKEKIFRDAVRVYSPN